MAWREQAATAPPAAPAPAATVDLQQTVQAALQDLLSDVGLAHEDSWEGPAAALPLPPLAAPKAPPSRCATGGGTALPAPGSARPSSSFFPPQSVAAAAAAGPAPRFDDDGDEPLQEGDLPSAAAARLYAARLKAAQGDLEGLQAALKARDIKMGALEKEVQQLRADKAAWQKAQKALEAQAERGKRAAEEARARLAEQENAIKAVGMERRASQQERRQAEADVKAREAKLAAALEEAQRLRRALEEAKGAAAARAGVSREEHARVAAENRQLVAQARGAKQELAVALKKAGRLIDVLRRQRVHLEAAALLQVSSRELAEALQGQQ
ncbi:hypothetical protein ABPG75_012483 [Micractinium tetrahymenae]